MTSLRSALLLGACYSCTIGSNNAFPTIPPQLFPQKCNLGSNVGRASTTSALNRNSPGFVDFASDSNPDRGSGGGGGGRPPSMNSRRPMDDPFSPRMEMSGRGRSAPPRGAWEEPPSGGAYGRVADRQSNLAQRPRYPSVNEDPRAFDMDRRFSQRPRSMGRPREQSWWDSAPSDGRIQGGSRQTYRDGSHTFVETDGRPLDVEMEVWDGPNNTPSRVKMYSEDGRTRPMNILTENHNPYQRGQTVSVRNAGPMEFPMTAGVSGQHNMMGGGGYDPYGAVGGPGMMNPSGMRPQGFSPPFSPSMARGETVQGGALKTFTMEHYVEAVQVTITSDGLPVNAKVELWGTGSNIKQLAEVYNDNGQTRPFAAIIDVPGGSNTIAVKNTGPIEYPIKVVVEPVATSMDDYGREQGRYGGEQSFGGRSFPPQHHGRELPPRYGENYGGRYLPPGREMPPRYGENFGGRYLPPY